MSPIDTVEAALTAAGCGPKRRGSGLDARCPAHDDRSPSLTVSPGTVHPVLLHCHAGCDPEDVRRALGIEWAELCEERPDDRPTVVAEYPYHDAAGTLVLTVRRLEPGYDGKRKSFTRSPKGAPSPLYRLPAVLATAAEGGTVHVVEGEKDAEALERAGAVATCNPGGAGKFLPEHAAALTGAHVVIVTDRDAPGYRHALDVFDRLTDQAASVRIVEALTGKDAADHLGAGHDLDAFAPVTPGELADRLAGVANETPDAAPVVDLDARLELPEGYELWTGADRPGRPEVSPGMFYGPLGEFAEAAGEHTEADPVAVLAQALAAFGTAAHRGPHLLAGNDRHAAALFVLIIGRSAKARKGTSWAASRDLIRRADAGLLERVLSGFGSGEALIAELAPPTGAEATVSALRDTRALVVESEFGEVLARARREGSTTSAILRNAWDGRPLQNRTRGTGKLVATDYHLGAIGHITAPELRAKLTDTDVYGGFLNRWLPFYVERSRLLPDGGNVPAELLDRYGRRLRDALTSVRGATVIERDAEAGELWRELYTALEDDDPPGMLGHVVARGAAQTLRLSLVFALADGSRVITADHVGAAYLVWTYSRASAAALFGETTGDRDADRLLDALREAGPGGMDGTSVRDLFARKPGRGDAARHVLEAHGMAAAVTEKGTGGRPRVTLYAIRRAAA